MVNPHNALIPGSLQALAAKSGRDLAELFMDVDNVILVDVSSSMMTRDSRFNKSRFDVACEELSMLQSSLPGKLAVFSFSNDVLFVPSGKPSTSAGSTDLSAALTFVQPADGTVDFVMVSDGEPDDAVGALTIARGFTSKINTVYVGPDDSRFGGKEFLEQLAAQSGGKSVVAAQAKELASAIQFLLKAGK